LYLTHMRLPGSAAQSVEIAHALLDRGADANTSWNDDWSKVAFHALTGVIALGEKAHPTHERAAELVALLIERGADPCDSQSLYNSSVVNDNVQWLDVLWTHSERRGVTNTWAEVSKQRIGGHRGMSPLDFLLSLAVTHNHTRRAEWLLAHGANANGVHADSGRRLREEALVHGSDTMARVLLRHGAADEPLQGVVAFQVACQRLDRDAARALIQLHPEFLRSAEVMLNAVRQKRADIIELLLELGMDADMETVAGFRALQSAVAADAMEVVKVLIAHGADVDRPADNYGSPMGLAAHYGRRKIASLLAPLSRDVHAMVQLGMKDRLRELLTAEPNLANLVHYRSGQTPLFSLPDDEVSALEMAKFLLEHGADVRCAKQDGDTAAIAVGKRGLNEVAQLLTDAMKRR
jgi:ankyrin repeat protein